MRDNTSHAVRRRTWLRALLVWALLAWVLSIAGCRDETPPAAADAGAAAPIEVVSGPLAALQLPAEVLACGGDDAPAWLRQTDAKDAGTSLLPGLVRQRYGLTETGFIAHEKPLRFALFALDGVPVPALMMTLADPAAWRGALPAEQHAHAKLIGDQLLLSDVALNETQLTFMRQLMAAELPASQAALVSLSAVRQLLSPKPPGAAATTGAGTNPTAAAATGAGTTAAAPGATSASPNAGTATNAGPNATSKASATNARPNTAANPNASSKPNTATSAQATAGSGPGAELDEWVLLRRLLSALDDFDKVVLTSKALDSRTLWTARLHPTEGGALAGTLAKMKARPLSLLAQAPPDAAALLAVSLDPSAPSPWLDGLSGWMVQVSLPETQAGAGYQQAREALRSAVNGELLLLLHRIKAPKGKDDRAAVSSVLGLRDSGSGAGMLVKLHEEQSDEGVQALYEQLGVEVTARRERYRVAEVAVDEVSAKQRIDPLRPAAPKAAGSAMLMQLLTVHTAVREQQLLRTFGATARPAMEAWLNDRIEGGGDKQQDIRRALSRGVAEPFLFMYAQPRKSMRLAKELSQQGSPARRAKGNQRDGSAGAAGSQQASEVLALSAGVQSGELLVTLDLPSTPLPLLRAILQAAQ